MRLCGFVPRKRILFIPLLDKVSRGARWCPWVQIPTPSVSFTRNPQRNETEEMTMTTINLKDFYYWYLVDGLGEGPDEVAEERLVGRRARPAQGERVRYNEAY